MVQDSDMGMAGENVTEEEESHNAGMSEESSAGMGEEHGMEEKTSAEEAPSGQPGAAKPGRSGGRRAALKIIRQNVEGVSKDLTNFRKTHEASSKRLEKQMASLRNDMEALKSYLAKENAKVRSKQDANFEKILSKLKSERPAKAVAALKKKAPKPKSKGKK